MSTVHVPLHTQADRRESPAARAFRAVYNVLQLLFTLAFTSAGIVAALLVLLVTRSPRLPLRMASRMWAPTLLAGAGARFSVEGAESVDWSKPRMIVANHQSIIDICALFRAVPVPLRFVMKSEMGKVPFLGQYARAMGMVFIERDSRRAGSKMLREVVDLLRGGATLCVFPEGTRSRDGRMAPFKGGAFQAAIDAGVEVLPVAIEGAGAVLSPEGLFRVRPGRIVVRIGPPLATAGVDRQALAQQAQAAVSSMLEHKA
ncbi:lysophospholipid acyltransferase family protein [Lysobacter brunescens]|uniref:1-acyl-sn-glycerol-3-phosphate acyltransferase n=1 Tax=Lysobacter brunescens TaxID=262323 RepID=A0ABW2YAB9_9GAMM